MNTKRETGEKGEQEAVNYLTKNGYRILARNFVAKFRDGRLFGEIDIIAKKGGVFRFVEVKTLTRELNPFSVFRPENRVDLAKRKKLIKTAEFWLASKKIPLNSKWQLDIIAVRLSPDLNQPEIYHFQNITF